MSDRITIEGRDGAFGAYIARPRVTPAPAVVVLQELCGVNADIRTTCDELAEQGFVAVAPDLFWRQEPGVDLSVTSEPDWQHGLRLYQAYDRDAGSSPPRRLSVTAYRTWTGTSRNLCVGSMVALILPLTSNKNEAVYDSTGLSAVSCNRGPKLATPSGPANSGACRQT